MKKLYILIVALAIVFPSAIYAGQMSHNHEGHSMASMGTGDAISGGLVLKDITADGYKVRFHIMDRDAFRKYMDSMGHSSHKMKSSSTDYIMLDIWDPKGRKVTKASVKIKVAAPNGNSRENRAFPMMESFGSEFSMAEKGSYGISMTFKAQGREYKGGFAHHVH